MNAQHTDIHRFRESLSQAIGVERFELWFGDSQALSLFDGQLVVQSDPFSLERVRTQFGSVLQQLAKDAGVGDLNIIYRTRCPDRLPATTTAAQAASCGVEIRSANGATSLPSTRMNPEAGASHRLDAVVAECNATHRCSTVPSPAKTVSSPAKRAASNLVRFVFGEENRLAQTAVQQVIAAPGKISPLFLAGPVGCGKSMLLAMMAKAPWGGAQPRRRVCVSAEQFTTMFVEALKGRGLPSFRQKFREIDLLAIDDLQFFQNKQATLVELKYTLDHLTGKGKQIVLAADRPLKELRFFEPELLNRISSGLACEISYPSLPTRKSILEAMCAEHELDVAGGILTTIAQNLNGDVRQLRGAVIRLKAAALSHVDIDDSAQVERLLADLFAAQQKSVSWTAIEQAVCDVCGVSEAELKSPRRSEHINVARNLAMWLSRKHIGVAYSDIGRHYGGRSHSTVIAANKKVSSWLQTGQRVRIGPHSGCSIEQAMREIESKLKIG